MYLPKGDPCLACGRPTTAKLQVCLHCRERARKPQVQRPSWWDDWLDQLAWFAERRLPLPSRPWL